jgi:threonylcarbamoyladenosine tRNA methylthiotransferase CDKAL1
MKFYIETYGCTANHGNSHEAAAALMEMGHHQSTLNDSDLVLINTCAVTEKTERHMIKRLQQLEGKRLLIAGCLPMTSQETIEDIHCLDKVGILNRSLAREIGEKYAPYSGEKILWPEQKQRDDLCGVVNISEGCIGKCSYCIVRKARGRLASKPPEEIAKCINAHLKSGMVEIQLASQDTAAYGKDIDSSLPFLLKEIAKIPGKFMIRVGMMNPTTVKPILGQLIESYGDEKIYKFLHLPVQSGSDSVLGSMNRGYTAEDFFDITARFRNAFPELTLSTDVIVGFPGETKEDFQATEDILRWVKPEKVNITRFSRRPHTAAWKMKDMPDHIKKARSRRLTKLWHEIAMDKNSSYLGRSIQVLVTECGKGMTMKARSQNYREIVIEGTPELGTYHKVEVVGFNPFYLKGEIQSG